MAGPKPGKRNRGRTVTNNEQRINLMLERNINVFELRYSKRFPYPRKLFGVDDVVVHIKENVNNHEIRYDAEIRNGASVEFQEDENNILTAYLPDTDKNRRILAKTWYISKWEIIKLMTQEGTIPKVQIQKQIKEFSDKLGIKPPVDKRAYKKHLRKREREAQRKKENAIMAGEELGVGAPVKRTEPLTKADAEAAAFQRYEGLISMLENKHGKGWKSSAEYKQVIKPEIDRLMAENAGPTKDTTPLPADQPGQPDPVDNGQPGETGVNRPWDNGQAKPPADPAPIATGAGTDGNSLVG